MNFLAHIYLSADDEELTIGNFIADSVKGKKYLQYREGIRNGIILHRAIDFYTDTHTTVKKSTSRLFESYGHYNGVIVDILYDHYLARNWPKYSRIPLEEYTTDFYKLLQKNVDDLPTPVQRFMPYMIKDNWLLDYATVDGIRRILSQMNERTQRRSKMHLAIKELELHYTDFEAEFFSFFEDLQSYCAEKIAGFKSMDRE